MILFPSLILLFAGLLLKALGYDAPRAILAHFGTLTIVNGHVVLVVPAEHLVIGHPILGGVFQVRDVIPVMVIPRRGGELVPLDRWLESQS